MHSDWHDWMRSDRTLLTILILAFAILWYVTQADKVFDMINLFSGALIAIITGAVFKRNGNGNPPPPAKTPDGF